jgi:hypothetical protein
MARLALIGFAAAWLLLWLAPAPAASAAAGPCRAATLAAELDPGDDWRAAPADPAREGDAQAAAVAFAAMDCAGLPPAARRLPRAAACTPGRCAGFAARAPPRL